MSIFDFSVLASNFSELITAIALIIAGAWSLNTYHRSKRVEAAKWLHELAQTFQFSENLEQGKFLLDFKYQEVVEPILSMLIFHRNKDLNDAQRKISFEMDKVLNQFEHLLYLQSNGHISKQDRDVYFGYWFGLFAKPKFGVLRRYCANFGYNLLISSEFPDHHTIQLDEYILVYGTLSLDSKKYKELGMHEHCEFIADSTVDGLLYDLGDYPGLVLKEDLDEESRSDAVAVPVQIFRVIKGENSQKPLQILTTISEYEEHNAQKPETSEYRCTTLSVPLGNGDCRVDAWVYLYQHEAKGKTAIANVGWNEYEQKRNSLKT